MDDDPSSSTVAFSILREGGMRLDLALAEIDRLHLHEETIPELLEDLTRAIEEDGILEDPVIVDRETFVVLDGMHRVKALRRLGCRFIPVCFVDYHSPEIRVDRWCRTVMDDTRMDELRECIESAGLEIEEFSDSPLVEPPLVKGVVGVLETRRGRYLLTSDGKMSVLSSFRAVGRVEGELRSRGFKIGYETERDAEEKLRSGEVDAVILPPKIGKEDVVETAVRGEVFIHKATRHIIPARPMQVNVPLALLRGSGLTLEEANKRLSETLRLRSLKRMPPGSLWKGRRYEEEIYLFE